MKVKLFKRANGNMDVMVKRTMAKENPSRSTFDVPPERVGEVIDKLVTEMRPVRPLDGA